MDPHGWPRMRTFSTRQPCRVLFVLTPDKIAAMDKPAGPQPMRFTELDLSPVMQQALQKAGFVDATPIQSQLIPLALEGLDVIGQARTGTGQTAAFGIPILEQLDSLEECRDPQALIVVPTRELADQVGREIERLAVGVPTEICVLA